MKKSILIFSCLILLYNCEKTKKDELVSEEEKDTSPIIAKVGDYKITLDQLKEKLNKEARYNPTKYQTYESKKELLDEMVNDEVLFQEARRLGLDNDEQIKRMMVRSLTRKVITYDKKVTDEDLEKYYQEHEDEFREIKASHILFKVSEGEFRRLKRLKEIGNKEVSKEQVNLPDTFEEYDKIQREKAEKVLQELKNGADFTKIAEKYSEGPTKSKGGDLGYFTSRRMEAEFSDAAFKLKNIGDISDVVKTKFGYHIIKLTDKRVAPFEKQKVMVRSKVIKDNRDKAYDEFVQKIKSNAKIKIYEENLGKIKEESNEK